MVGLAIHHSLVYLFLLYYPLLFLKLSPTVFASLRSCLLDFEEREDLRKKFVTTYMMQFKLFLLLEVTVLLFGWDAAAQPSNSTSLPSPHSSHQTLKNVHGIINVVSWGIMLPIGVVIARHAMTFQVAYRTWFYIHATCQSFGYAIGVIGWAMGLKLGNYNKGVIQTSHGTIGIAIFCLATLQVFAQFLQPKRDHKFRLYWNIYHHSVGYLVLILSVINNFKGLNILNPEKKWKTTFFVVGFSLGAIAMALEVVKWIIFFRNLSRNSSTPTREKTERGQLNGPDDPI